MIPYYWIIDYEGQFRMHSSSVEGSVSAILKAIPQTFHRVQCSAYQDTHDARFQYFVETVCKILSWLYNTMHYIIHCVSWAFVNSTCTCIIISLFCIIMNIILLLLLLLHVFLLSVGTTPGDRVRTDVYLHTIVLWLCESTEPLEEGGTRLSLHNRVSHWTSYSSY